MRLISKYSYFILFVLLFITTFSLRFYHVSSNPPGLYIDEVAIGVDAYQILTTGHDQFGEKYPLWFKSFGDYKMPLYIYLTSFSMFLFGKNEFAVRFPAIVMGSCTILLCYLFVKELLLNEIKTNLGKVIPFLSAFLLAISPWHIQFSRGGFEVTVAVFLYLLGSYLFLLFWRKTHLLTLLLSFLSYILSVYTYHSFRLIAPITLLFLFCILLYNHKLQKKIGVILIIMNLLLLFPMISFSLTSHGAERFSQTSTFAEYPVDSFAQKIVVYPMVFLKNYLSYFSLHFLFNYGDGIGRHQLPKFGVLPRWELLFLLTGIFWLVKHRNKLFSQIIFLLLFISPLPAALARPSPHSLRALLLVLPLTITVALGIYFVFSLRNKWKYGMGVLVLLIVSSEFVFYLHHYYGHYPKVNLLDWGAGYKNVVLSAQKHSNKYPIIIIDNSLQHADIYFTFYDDTLKPRLITNQWKPKDSEKDKIQVITPYYGNPSKEDIIENIYLPNGNNDIFAQILRIK